MQSLRVLLGSLVLASALGVDFSALASDAARPDNGAGRYTMHQADGGYLRLDTQSGQMSMCARRDGRWQCESIGDERSALQQEVDRLARENRDLKATVKNLEEMIGVGGPADGDKRAERGIGPKMQLPTEEDVDKALSYAQRMLRKFRDKIKELSEDSKGTPL